MSIPVRIPGYSVSSTYVKLQDRVVVFTKALEGEGAPFTWSIYRGLQDAGNDEALEAFNTVISIMVFGGMSVELEVYYEDLETEIESKLAQIRANEGIEPVIVERGKLRDVYGL